LLPESDFELGERIAHGMANFRWPYTQYELKRKTTENNSMADIPSGTCETISFVKDSIVFQVTRLKPGRLRQAVVEPEFDEDISPSHSRKTSSVPPDGASPAFLDSAIEHDPFLRSDDSASQQSVENGSVKFKVGGRIQFGCICSNGDCSYLDNHSLALSAECTGLRCESTYYQKRLEVELFVNSRPQNLTPRMFKEGGDNVVDQPPDTRTSKPDKQTFVDISVETQAIPISGECITIVCVYALKNRTDESSARSALSQNSSLKIEEYLGVARESEDMTDRLWAACVLPNYDEDEADEVCAMARAVEEIMCVSSLPMSRPEQTVNESSAPVSASGRVKKKHRTSQYRAPDVAEGTALLRNIVSPQYVDLQSSL